MFSPSCALSLIRCRRVKYEVATSQSNIVVVASITRNSISCCPAECGTEPSSAKAIVLSATELVTMITAMSRRLKIDYFNSPLFLAFQTTTRNYISMIDNDCWLLKQQRIFLSQELISHMNVSVSVHSTAIPQYLKVSPSSSLSVGTYRSFVVSLLTSGKSAQGHYVSSIRIILRHIRPNPKLGEPRHRHLTKRI